MILLIFLSFRDPNNNVRATQTLQNINHFSTFIPESTPN